ncbi:thiamine diphosphokinase [Rhodosalinus halophilus]|jgi:thiamine pyrophosphokinase|uniref:Thiamine diphosphokinase n=1 Tax=Rhodosalinus halophilus TaxID=2259333 RepID=A0A365UCN4_9RHOB|nr:thiamine diphosphokinase [Rhodosalinus halophilus]RBI87013.1 thiamine diphosphokinase [Rhodosalinus halophilus]
MNEGIVSPRLVSPAPVTLVGAGAASAEDLRAARAHAPRVAAADGGARLALAEGILPEAVFGDFDSMDAETRRAIPEARLHHVAEQETTDFDKALRHIEAPLVIGVGFLGTRIDHLLAAQTVLIRRAYRRCLLLGAGDIVFLCPPEIALDLPSGSRVSLYPMAEVTGRSEGLLWPIEGLSFAPGGMIGTSNRVTDGPVRLEAHAPRLLVILPRAALGAAVRSLAAPGPAWPAP